MSLYFCSACKVVINLSVGKGGARAAGAEDQYEMCLLNPVDVFVEKGNKLGRISGQICF